MAFMKVTMGRPKVDQQFLKVKHILSLEKKIYVDPCTHTLENNTEKLKSSSSMGIQNLELDFTCKMLLL